MSSIPNNLSDWNYDVIKKLVDEGFMETDTFDFKREIRSRDPNNNDRIIQAACAFANTKGGFLVFGVHDLGNGRAEIEGIERSDNIAKEFGDKVRMIEPNIYFDFSNPPISIPHSQRVLVVFGIPQSSERPHMTRDGKFYIRTNQGNRVMTYEEAKEAFLRYDERKHKLRLLYLEMLSNALIAKRMIIPAGRMQDEISLHSLDTQVISDILPDIYSMVQDDAELVELLLELRMEMSAINSKTRLFQSQISLPLTNRQSLTFNHNSYIESEVTKRLLPMIEMASRILETRYGLVRPKGVPV